MIKWIMNLLFGENLKAAKAYWTQFESPSMEMTVPPVPNCVKYGNQTLYGRNGLWRKYA